jgi:phosphoribosylanthranilate isomerase
MKPHVKICGITTPDALDTCAAHGAAYIGFVFHTASQRNIQPAQAAMLASRLPASVRSVAVVVNPDNAFLDRLTAEFRPNFIQLHGDETPARAHEIRTHYSIPIIKALRIAHADDLKPAHDFDDCAQMLLLDAKPTDPTVMGGSGHCFDWQLLMDFKVNMPWFLSGGLDISNVDAAIAQTKAQYFDISSGVESSKGVKDNAKIETLLKKIHSNDLY